MKGKKMAEDRDMMVGILANIADALRIAQTGPRGDGAREPYGGWSRTDEFRDKLEEARRDFDAAMDSPDMMAAALIDILDISEVILIDLAGGWSHIDNSVAYNHPPVVSKPTLQCADCEAAKTYTIIASLWTDDLAEKLLRIRAATFAKVAPDVEANIIGDYEREPWHKYTAFAARQDMYMWIGVVAKKRPDLIDKLSWYGSWLSDAVDILHRAEEIRTSVRRLEAAIGEVAITILDVGPNKNVECDFLCRLLNRPVPSKTNEQHMQELAGKLKEAKKQYKALPFWARY